MMQTFFQDIHFGIRSLWKQPAFTAVAVITIALGIGGNTAMFSVVNAVLLKPFPSKIPSAWSVLKAGTRIPIWPIGSSSLKRERTSGATQRGFSI